MRRQGFEDYEAAMLRELDLDRVEREFGQQFPVKEQKVDEPAPRRIVSAGRCRKTGKVQFYNAADAMEALRSWLKRDPRVCWDKQRLRIYQCKKCHKFHLGKHYG